ncbi:MAG: hypothetical protein ACI8UO_000877 [Verrucomicrobiales bacterium]|jgi:hypothetical protein
MITRIGLAILGCGPAAAELKPQEFLSTYCFECHGTEKQKGDRQFNALGVELSNLDTIETWQEILDQLNLGEMPPSKAKQPTPEEIKSLVSWVSSELKAAHESLDADLARPVVRRLNRVQYDRTVRSLLHLEPMLADPTESFPPDVRVENFDTIGSALVTSDFLLESYLQAAGLLIEKATCVTPEPPKPQTWTFQAPFSKLPARPDGLDEPGKFQHIRKNNTYEDGYLWLSKFPKGVPQDGWYELTFKAQGINRDYPYDENRIRVRKSEPLRVGVVAGHPGYGDLKAPNGSDRPLLELDLPDDEPRVFKHRIWLDQGFQPRFCFPNGPNRTKPFRGFTVQDDPHHFAEFIKFLGPNDGEFRKLPPELTKGAEKGASRDGKELDSRKFYTNKNSYQGWSAWTRAYEGPRVRIYEVSLEGPFFDSWPTESHAALYGENEISLTNAEPILRSFANRAFRRPVADEELAVLMKLVEQRAAAGFSEVESVQAGLQAVLCSPGFLYLEQDGDHALAERLSYFIWSDSPDSNLRSAAAKNELSKEGRILTEAERLLADDRVETFVDQFTDSWLQLDKVGKQPPSHSTFPTYFTHSLESAMLAESRLFFRHLLDENLPITNFIDSEFTFLNSNLAAHYGIDGVRGHQMRKVEVSERRRGGLLGQAAVLTASANGIDTSPVIRGIWVLEKILGDPPLPPPPDIEPIEPDIRGVASIREQLVKHREVETCAECHRKIDPLGFALENFDPVGGWRARYEQTNRKPVVDASGQLPDGSEFGDVVDLKQLLLARKHQFAHCLTEKLLTYSTGHQMGPADRPHIDSIVHELEERGWGLRDLVLLVIESKPFRG